MSLKMTNDLLKEIAEHDAHSSMPLGQPINTLDTGELIQELINRIQQSNGLEFVDVDKIRFLSNSLTNELAEQAKCWHEQLENIISGSKPE